MSNVTNSNRNAEGGASMSDVLWMALGVIVGGGGVWLVQRPHWRYLRDELTTAQDRLYHAWRDERAVIPAREMVQPTKQVTVEALPPVLLNAVLDYESPEGRRAVEETMRQRLKQGWGADRILSELRG